MKRPNCTRHWTTIYYGPRGTCKSIHAVRELTGVLRWLHVFYTKHPTLHRAIVMTDFDLSPELEKLYGGRDLFHFDEDDLETLRWCPREGCWRGAEKHKLHGCYLFIDDASNMLAAEDWSKTPRWFKRMMIKGRKFGIHLVITLVDPFDLVIAVRRASEVANRFRVVWKTRDPDETMPPLKRVFGWYQRRYVSTEMLWKYGDLPEQIIKLRQIQQEELHEKLREMEKAHAIVYDDSWRGTVNFFNRTGRFLHFWRCGAANDYDTHQDVAEKDED
jgi:hypothetical protein